MEELGKRVAAIEEFIAGLVKTGSGIKPPAAAGTTDAPASAPLCDGKTGLSGTHAPTSTPGPGSNPNPDACMIPSLPHRETRERYSASPLTVIIPFLNEGIEVEKTLRNIRETASFPLEIILINDASDDGYDYGALAGEYACLYVEHKARKGVAASRDEGVGMCHTEYFLLLDAHMEFYRDYWDLEIAGALRENPDSILCCQTKVLHERRDVPGNSPQAFGASLSLSRKDIFKCAWNLSDHSPQEAVIEIPVVLGGAYAARKDYWQGLHGLKGLVDYGMDEELISLKAWTAGGRCLLLGLILI